MRLPQLSDRLRFWLVNASFVVLVLAAVGLLQWLSREFHLQFDLTQNARHTLSEASRAVLARIEGPLVATAYVDNRGEVRRAVQEIIARYQRHKPDFTLEFVNPDVDPERVRAANIMPGGEVFLAYKGTTERLAVGALTEEGLTNALTRLGRSGERWWVFLTGHGERSPERQANFDVSTWAAQLRTRGIKTRTLSLAENAQVPRNTTTLVVAGPRVKLLEGEVKAIEAYVKTGGNLLWLIDPGPLHGLERLAEFFGIELQPGMIVDPVADKLVGDPTAVIVSRYTNHPVVKNFTNVTVFPQAAGLSVQAPEGWTSTVMLDTNEGAWAETGPVVGEVQFDRGRDVRGPLNVAVALTRDVEGREQRAVVIGDGDFLSNQVLANGGNLELGMNLANWLSQDDAYVDIPAQTARDRKLDFSPRARLILRDVFVFLLPLALLGSGLAVWWRRRRR